MSDVAVEQTTVDEPAAERFQLGSVNIDSLKDILNMLGNTYPWQDETSKNAYHEQVAGLSEAGDPNAAPAETLSEAEAEIAALKEQLAAAEAKASSVTPPATQ